MDILSYLLGKKAGSGSGGETRNWAEVGYESEPEFLSTAFTHAKEIYDEWDPTETNLFAKFQADLDLIYFPLVDTSNVTSMESMFISCGYLEYVPAIDTSNVTTMLRMFAYDNSLKEVDFTNFDTSNVTTMERMFFRAYGLRKLVMPFDTAKVTNFSHFCEDDYYLAEVDMSSFDSPLVTDCTYMFSNCKALKKIDARKFDFTVLTTSASYNNMFGANATSGPPNDCLIIVKDNDQKSWFSSHFSRFTNLKTPEEL